MSTNTVEVKTIAPIKDLKSIPLQNRKKCNLSKRQLLELSNIAIEKINEINSSVNQIMDDFSNNDDGGNGYYDSMVDQAVRAYNNPLRISRMNNYNKVIDKLREFVNQVMAGNYSNLCSGMCQTFIPFERLKAVPHTSQCIDCKNGEYKKNGHNSRH